MRSLNFCFGVVVFFLCLPAFANINIRCSSERGGREYCQADTSGSVDLLKQISTEVCRKGYSWGKDGNGIWVDHGCKADFSIGALGLLGVLIDHTQDYQKTNVFQCQSDSKKRTYCQADTRGGLRFMKSLGGAACIYEKTWGYDVGGVWVERNCKAEFEVGGAVTFRPLEVPGTGNLWGAGNGIKAVSCASDGGKKHYCEADTSDGVVLMKDLSGTSCARGVTWGFDRRGIWVEGACKADFQAVSRDVILK